MSDPQRTKRVDLDVFSAQEIRHAIIGLAHVLASPDQKETGAFDWVTQGRQSSWIDGDGHRRTYSACEDLAQAVYCGVCGVSEREGLADEYAWVNRAPNWRPGWNLISIKQHTNAWRQSTRGMQAGDIVQVQASSGPHTFVLLAERENENGMPVWDTADYGQFRAGLGHCGIIYEGVSVNKDAVWSANQGAWRHIIGWVDSVQLVQAMPSHPGPALVADNYVEIV